MVSVDLALIALLKALSDNFCNSVIFALASNNDCTRFSEVIIGFIQIAPSAVGANRLMQLAIVVLITDQLTICPLGASRLRASVRA
jgi:hypothetical protein